MKRNVQPTARTTDADRHALRDALVAAVTAAGGKAGAGDTDNQLIGKLLTLADVGVRHNESRDALVAKLVTLQQDTAAALAAATAGP